MPMTDETELDDAGLSPAELQMVGNLTLETLAAIDETLLRQASTEWRKMARVVGMAMLSMANRIPGIPDRFYADRVVMLIQSGQLEFQGNLRRMRFCEVRLLQTGLK